MCSCLNTYILDQAKPFIQYVLSEITWSLMREENVFSYVVSIIKHESDDRGCTWHNMTNEVPRLSPLPHCCQRAEQSGRWNINLSEFMKEDSRLGGREEVERGLLVNRELLNQDIMTEFINVRKERSWKRERFCTSLHCQTSYQSFIKLFLSFFHYYTSMFWFFLLTLSSTLLTQCRNNFIIEKIIFLLFLCLIWWGL